MATLTNSGRTALAIALTAQPIYLAWGAGDPSWDSTPVAEPVTATTLVAELGRRAATIWQYVVPDSAGSITVPTGSFSPSPSNAPTNYIYLFFQFDYADAAASVIREVGVFIGTILNAGLPPGEVYFDPSDIANPGNLYCLQYFTAITRSANTRQNFEFVLET